MSLENGSQHAAAGKDMAEISARVQSYGQNIWMLPGTSVPATFFGADLKDDWHALDIALIGIPSDAGLTCRPGARYGPQAVRAQSAFIGYSNPATRVTPYELARVGDGGNVPLENALNVEALVREIEAFYQEVRRARVIPLSVGGDHSITYPILKALAAERPVGLIHIDAHFDTYGPLHGVRYHHGTPFYHSIHEGLVDPRRMVQVALRDPYYEFASLSSLAGVTVLPMHDCQQIGLPEVLSNVRQVIGDGPVYLSFDIDALDPAFAPGTGTPVVGGLSTREALHLLRGLRGLDIIGADVVEVSPPYDPNGTTALAGAQILFEELCLAAEAHARRQERNCRERR